MTARRRTGAKRAKHLNRRPQSIWRGFIPRLRKPESGLVDGVCRKYSRFRDLNFVTGGLRIGAASCRIETAHARVSNTHVRMRVPDGRCIVRTDLIIQPRVDIPTLLGDSEDIRIGTNNAEGGGIERCSIDDGAVVYCI